MINLKENPIFTFAKCKDKRFKWEWWALKVETPREFKSFIEVRSNALQNTYIGLKETKKHLTQEEYCYAQKLNTVSGRRTFVDDISVLDDMVLGSYAKFWIDGEILLVNSNWGFYFLNDNIKILETNTRNAFIFPDEKNTKIRIIKWPAGKHYYAKVGKRDVCIDGEQKWNTYAEAQRNAELFLEEINMKEVITAYKNPTKSKEIG